MGFLKLSKKAGEYLKHSNLSSSDGQGYCHMTATRAEAITLSWCSEVDPTQIGNVCVTVLNISLDVSELRAWT